MKRKAKITPDELDDVEDFTAEDVDDEAAGDSAIPPVRYEISSYGIDFDVKGLVERLKEGKVFVPEFQRSFVWRLPDSSRFIESLLLGLPVPGVFLAKELESQKMFVIDGQQRLRTLQYFYEGVFNPKESKKTQRTFRLTGVQEPFGGKRYEDLDERTRQILDDSVIHATVVKQDSPKDDDTSIYHVYERLNSGGRRLHPQEIRTAVFHGPLVEQVKKADKHPSWRTLFGPKNPRLKDEEMILRFLALYESVETYERPMEEFLSKFANQKRKSDKRVEKDLELFKRSADLILSALGDKAFRPERNFNAAVFDSVTYGIAKRISGQKEPRAADLRQAFRKLMKRKDYQQATSRSTADKAFVEKRLKAAEDAFSV